MTWPKVPSFRNSQWNGIIRLRLNRATFLTMTPKLCPSSSLETRDSLTLRRGVVTMAQRDWLNLEQSREIPIHSLPLGSSSNLLLETSLLLKCIQTKTLGIDSVTLEPSLLPWSFLPQLLGWALQWLVKTNMERGLHQLLASNFSQTELYSLSLNCLPQVSMENLTEDQASTFNSIFEWTQQQHLFQSARLKLTL